MYTENAQISCAKALQAANPHLIAGNDLITAAKNIRIELKCAFPGVKFSVKTDRFAGGNAIRINWTDGPTRKEVEAIADKYSAGSFDGMNDLYTYEHSAWTEAFGDAKYITTSRSYSPELVTATIATVGAKWHDGELPTAEDYQQGRLFYAHPDRHCDSWQHLVYRTIEKSI